MQWLKGPIPHNVDNSVDKVDNSAKRRNFSQFGAIIGVFAKQPVPGQVKTRLTPPLSPQQASRLYQVALAETVARLQATGFAMTICYAGERGWFETNYPGQTLVEQRGNGLGVRMTNAFEELFATGAAPVLLAGSDNPDLPAALVREVVALLDDVDVVTVPCRDGGYAIIGLRSPTKELFADIPWSTSQVLEATRRRCGELGLSYRETAEWDDLDLVDDLRRLVDRSPESLTAQHIQRELEQLL